jgi:hypothetical protein
MGEVYVGYDEKLKRKKALKALRAEKHFHAINFSLFSSS